MKFRLLVLIAVLVVAAYPAFSNGLSLNSIGPKSFGLGGAFVGLANDYTSLYWNPSGLTQIQKNFIGIFATDVSPRATYKYTAAGIDAKSKVRHYISPNIMGSFSFSPTNDLVIGLGVYVPAGLGTDWDGNSLKVLSSGKVVEWMSKIGVINISPAIAYKLNENISLGIAVNIFYGMFDLKRPSGGGYQYSESSNGLGYGVTVGTLVKANDMFSFGASLRTKTNVKMSGTAKDQFMTISPYSTGAPSESGFDRDVAWPMWIGAGVAFHPFDYLVITADAQFSQWSKSENEFTAKFDNALWEAGTTTMKTKVFKLHWKDVTQYRLGIGYTFTENIDFRMGYYYDPAPAPDETYNILFPNITYNGITFGMGYKVDDWTLDGGIEYLIGNYREIKYDPTSAAMPGTHSMDIWAWSLGVGYGF